MYQKAFISIRVLETTTEIELSTITGLFLMRILFVKPAASLPKRVLLVIKHDNNMINDYVLNSYFSKTALLKLDAFRHICTSPVLIHAEHGSSLDN